MGEAGDAVSSPGADAPSGRLLGMQQFEAEPGLSRVEFQAREEFYNPGGVVQGGFLAVMLDFTMGEAARSVVEPTMTPLTVEMKISYIQPAKAGKLIGKGRVVHKGRSARRQGHSSPPGHLPGVSYRVQAGRVARKGSLYGR